MIEGALVRREAHAVGDADVLGDGFHAAIRLEPVQGARGGYILIKPLNKISMTELFESLEGPLGIMDCFLEEECEIIDSCSIRTPIQRINRSLRNLFDDMTVLDVTN